VGGSPGSAKRSRSFIEQKSENEARLKAIAALSLGDFNASKMQLMAEGYRNPTCEFLQLQTAQVGHGGRPLPSSALAGSSCRDHGFSAVPLDF
jgi:hypothetical protein